MVLGSIEVEPKLVPAARKAINEQFFLIEAF